MAMIQIRGLNLNIKKRYADGRVRYRHYNKRGAGAVCIGETERKIKGALPDELWRRLQQIADAPPPVPVVAPPRTLSDLFDDWRASAEYRRDVTSKSTRRLHDDNIEKWRAGEYLTEKGAIKRFGEMPFVLVEHDWAKDRLLTFRDKHAVGWRPCKTAVAKSNAARRGPILPARAEIGAYWIKTGGAKPYGFQFRETPKSADHLLNTLSACLAWAKARGKLKINPMEGVKRLYKNNRAAIIWAADNLLQLKAGAANPDEPKPLSPQLWAAVCLAALTGLSQADLLRLTWDMVLVDVIDLDGGRKKTGVEQMPPILPLTRQLLERLRQEQGGNPAGDQHVLLSSRGTPWTGDGFRSSMQVAKERAGIRSELHFHDLRGTAATMFAVAGYSDLQIDLFMGWSEGDSAHIRRKYVSARNVTLGLTALFQSASVTIADSVADACAAD